MHTAHDQELWVESFFAHLGGKAIKSYNSEQEQSVGAESAREEQEKSMMIRIGQLERQENVFLQILQEN
jgi:hypothetical protein